MKYFAKKNFFYITLSSMSIFIIGVLFFSIVYIFLKTFPSISVPVYKGKLYFNVSDNSKHDFIDFTNNFALSFDRDGYFYQYNLISNYPQNQVKTKINTGLGKLKFITKKNNLLVVMDKNFKLFFIKVMFHKEDETYSIKIINKTGLSLPILQKYKWIKLYFSNDYYYLVAYTQKSIQLLQFYKYGNGKMSLLKNEKITPLPDSIKKFIFNKFSQELYIFDKTHVITYSFKGGAKLLNFKNFIPGNGFFEKIFLIGKGKYFLVLNRKGQVFIELAQTKGPVVNRMLFHTRKSQKIVTIIPENNQRSFFVIYKSGWVDLYNILNQKPLVSFKLSNVVNPSNNESYLDLSPFTESLIEVNSHSWVSNLYSYNVNTLSVSEIFDNFFTGSNKQYLNNINTLLLDPKLQIIPTLTKALKATFIALLLGLSLSFLAAIYIGIFASEYVKEKARYFFNLVQVFPTILIALIFYLCVNTIININLSYLVIAMFLIIVMVISMYKFFSSNFTIKKMTTLSIDTYLLLVTSVSVIILFVFLKDILHIPDFTTNKVDIDNESVWLLGFAVGIAIIPTMVSILIDAIDSISKKLIEESIMLGASYSFIIKRLIIPQISQTYIFSIMLSFGRAVGEITIILFLLSLASNSQNELYINDIEVQNMMSHYKNLYLITLGVFIFTLFINFLISRLRTKNKNLFKSSNIFYS
ncbi:hypothetical protein CF386_05090 [Paraphotobacterium marinum]|uniref:ABC transmembrane type-1 domain-containing protein n=1 Tax=Paraphotobacterium marinum TaxID=1755811 RepID=A0A220VES2_9GAMM|nr:hypothetical protein CF386_05090 [Paraphotobacterium marinum]